MRIIFIPGLGFDHRIFKNLSLGNADTIFLDWIEPLENEKIEAYAQRLFKDIDDHAAGTILIGHSFGGMLSQVIATQKRIDSIILISSIRSRKELPVLFKLAGPLRLHWMISRELILYSFPIWAGMHDYQTPEERALFRDMVKNQANRYFRWALKTLSGWKAPTLPSQTNIVQIHGDSDNTLPLRLLTKPDVIIKNAGHFMVYKHADLIAAEIKKALTFIRSTKD